MIDLNKASPSIGSGVRDISPSKSLASQIQTPYDELIPSSEEPSTQYYLDTMRIYLALCAGSISVEAALQAVEILRDNPEYVTCPWNPARIPINNTYKSKILDNLKTLKKFNLITRDSMKSALSFAFLVEDGPISATDERALKLFSRNPTISLVDAAREIDLTPRTVARALERLGEKNTLRFSTLLDFSVFNLQHSILFFTLEEDVEWTELEQGFARYPFTKNILKTTMTDLGYVSFLIPGFQRNRNIFQTSLREISNELLEYASLHYQQGTGVTTNLDLFHGGEWSLPTYITDEIRSEDGLANPPLLLCKGTDDGLTKDDLAVATHLQFDSRAPPSRISKTLAIRGFDMDSRRVAQSGKKLRDRNVLLDYASFGGINLSSNFCFEIVCDDEWKERTMRIVSQFPWSMYYTSNRGIIVWTITPGSHQVDYYQVFRALEQNPGVQQVNPIMTLAQGGSRSTLDLVEDYSYVDGEWSVPPEETDLRNYLL
jgi:DNA-binding Lrp family transcriptional regulator